MADIVGRFMKLFLRGHSEPFAVILRHVLSGAKELLLIKQMPRLGSAQAPDLLSRLANSPKAEMA